MILGAGISFVQLYVTRYAAGVTKSKHIEKPAGN